MLDKHIHAIDWRDRTRTSNISSASLSQKSLARRMARMKALKLAMPVLLQKGFVTQRQKFEEQEKFEEKKFFGQRWKLVTRNHLPYHDKSKL